MKVAIWFDAPHDYYGGINYFKNLLYALSSTKNSEVEVIMFFSTDMAEENLELFRPYAKIIKTSILTKFSFLWFLHQFLFRIFASDALISMQFRSNSIDIVSHSWSKLKLNNDYKIISWIPDFQYLHLPELFPNLDKVKESNRWKEIISNSNLVILSSKDSFNDFISVADKKDHHKGKVLNFVSQPKLDNLIKIEDVDVAVKHKLDKYFFYLPNQFWAHKNHLDVFKAVNFLKKNKKDIILVCSGELKDHRLNNSSYAEELISFITDNNLNDNIKILGKIEYIDVLRLMKSCLAVINPSLFEGWSSTVEESKSIGKTIILSDIEVHKEQDPPHGIFFKPNDIEHLSNIIESLWDKRGGMVNENNEPIAKKSLNDRTINYGSNYLEILRSVVNEH
jgi:glycosyltransferase involved in cell wall biosynthesis